MNDDQLHVDLSFIWLVLVRYGHHSNTLSGLRAPRKRMRTRNRENGHG